MLASVVLVIDVGSPRVHEPVCSCAFDAAGTRADAVTGAATPVTVLVTYDWDRPLAHDDQPRREP